jgi:AcrR family transcriptional regulator
LAQIKRNRAATIKRIVSALEEVLAEQGIEGVSINVIAQKAGVSKVLIYRYFGNLDTLVEYYVRMGHLVPHFSTDWLEQIQPVHVNELAPIWSGQALQLFRQFRASQSSRELLKATVQVNNPLADRVSRTLDEELTHLVNQLAFIKGGDHVAISAVMLGALSYLTIQAQNDRTMIGLDLRSEGDWHRIEEAIRLMYKAIATLAIESPTTQVTLKPVEMGVSVW